jgi:hypothetical protein
MNFIQPPTDNLYKFQALSGVALILFALTVPAKFFHEVQLRKFEVERHNGMTKPEYELYKGREDLLGQAYQKHLKEMEMLRDMAERVPAESRTAEQSRILVDFERSIVADKQRYTDLSLKNSEQAKTADQHLNVMTANEHELGYLTVAMWTLALIAGGCFAIGIVLARRGFKSWFEKAQRHQDVVLERQAAGQGNASNQPKRR